MRESLGLDPFDNAAADRPMVLTATGYMPIEAGAGGRGTNGHPVLAVNKYNADEPRVPKGHPTGGQWTVGNEDDDEKIRLAQDDTVESDGYWEADHCKRALKFAGKPNFSMRAGFTGEGAHGSAQAAVQPTLLQRYGK